MSVFNNTDLAAFKNVWVFCEQRQGKLMPTDFELISEGRRLADELGVKLCGLLLGDGVEGLAKDLAGYGADEEMGYGYYFWLNHGAANSYRCYGREGQFVIILPEKNAVIATQAMHSNVQPILDAVWKHILSQI